MFKYINVFASDIELNLIFDTKSVLFAISGVKKWISMYTSLLYYNDCYLKTLID